VFKIFNDKEYKRKFMGLLIPIAIQETLVIFISTINILILGAVDQSAMSGVSIANNIFLIFNSSTGGVLVAGCLLCAQFYGKKDIESVNKIFYLSLKISLIISLIFFLIAEIIPYQLLNLFAPGETVIIEAGVRYLRFFAITFFFRAVSGIYFYLLKNLNKAKQISMISLLALIINASVTSLTVFAFNQKEMGAAYGIISSRLVEMILAIIIVRKTKSVRFTLKDFLHTDSLLFKEFFRHLIPLFISKFAWGLGSVMISVFLGRLGSDIIAATALWNIARNIAICIPSGVTGAAAILLGQELGSNKLKSAKEHANKILNFTLFIGILNMFIFMGLIGINFGISSNTLTPEAKKYLILMALIYIPTFPFQSYNSVLLDGVYSSGGDTIFTSLVNVLTYWAVVVPLGFLSTSLNWAPLLIFFLITSEEIFKFFPTVLRYRQNKWIRNIADENK